MYSKLFQLLASQVTDWNSYRSGSLKIIGHVTCPYKDYMVKDLMSYTEWVATYIKYPVIKVEGIEKLPLIQIHFKKEKFTDIHLFISQKSGYSFRWHKDGVTVKLLVLKGFKRLYLNSGVKKLSAGRSALIPKGQMHKVYSRKGTWALSIGLSNLTHQKLLEKE